MKKIKFLSCAFLAAIMALGFTSCEKENFINGGGQEIVIPTPEAEPAVVVINPSVIGFINGVPTDITEDAKISFNTPTAGSDGTIPAQKITITVTYDANVDGATKTIVTTKDVQIPNLSKGMCCTITPTIHVIVNTVSEIEKDPERAVTIAKESNKGTITFVNESDYYYTNYRDEYEYTEGEEVVSGSIEWTEAGKAYQNDAYVWSLINMHNTKTTKTKEIKDIWVYAQSQTIIHVETFYDIVEYIIHKNVSFSRAAENDPVQVDIVKFQVKDYHTTIDNASAGPKNEENPHGYDANINLNGVGHGHGHGQGHGHGHGHGSNGNAGGGIVWGE